MSQELIQAVMVLTKQKGFAPEVIFESLEAALLQACIVNLVLIR